VPREREDTSTVKEISVVLVEDEDLVRSSVRKILEQSGFSVRGEGVTAHEGIEVTLRERPDVCLVDVRLPDRDGIEVARELTKSAPAIAVVMLSASAEHDDLIDAIRAGAVGYLLKGMDPERLAHALRGVVEGEAAIPRPLMAHLVKALQTQGRRRAVIGKRGRVDLTSREWEVLDMLCEGLSTAEIAERLSLSSVTVRRHVSGTVRKLGVRDRVEAVALVEGRS
jgi:two-component system nitrate/nitrite response regulator NarL